MMLGIPKGRFVLYNQEKENDTVLLEKTLESPLDSEDIQPVHPKGNKSWILFGGIDAEAETAILWPPDVKNWLIGKDPDAGKDWSQEEKQATEDEMAGWHHWLNAHELGQTLGDDEGCESLVCRRGSWRVRQDSGTE